MRASSALNLAPIFPSFVIVTVGIYFELKPGGNMFSVDVVVALANYGVTVTQDHVLEVRLPVLVDDIEVCVNDKEEV